MVTRSSLLSRGLIPVLISPLVLAAFSSPLVRAADGGSPLTSAAFSLPLVLASIGFISLVLGLASSFGSARRDRQDRSGLDRGWPYCYYDPAAKRMKLAPEYGGEGTIIGRCDKINNPEVAVAGHAAVLGMVFGSGTQFPFVYRNGIFIANHGSRFDANATGDRHGYDVEFAPFTNGGSTGEVQEFATGFDAVMRPLPEAALQRPVGLAMMPDGSLLIGDDETAGSGAYSTRAHSATSRSARTSRRRCRPGPRYRAGHRD